jgi:hypothetical protein
MARLKTMQRIFHILTALAALLLTGAALAAEFQKRPIGSLQEAVYGFAVAEQCGLLNSAVAEGFHLEHRWIVARDGIAPERERADRKTALMAAAWQYGNHGLGGYRGWCRSDGMAAVHRFLSFREAILGK